MRYVLDGVPIAWMRSRIHDRRFYDGQKASKMLISGMLAVQHNLQPMYSGPLSISLDFYFGIPKAYHKKVDTMRNSPYIYVPDIDNLTKFYLDAATGILFEDDKAVYSIAARKMYCTTPRTEITITGITNG